MSDPNRARSTAANHSGERARAVARRPRRRSRTPQATPSSTRTRRAHRQPGPSPPPPNGTDGHVPDTAGSQAGPPPGSLDQHGYPYHPTVGGQDSLQANGASFGDKNEGRHGTDADNGQGNDEQGLNGDLAERSCDDLSRGPNQGSQSSNSTQTAAAEGDAGHPVEGWYAYIQEHFQDGLGPWSAVDTPSERNLDGDVAYADQEQVARLPYIYPPFIELDLEENDDA